MATGKQRPAFHSVRSFTPIGATAFELADGTARWNQKSPLEWAPQHDRALRMTALGSQVETPRLIANRPVPRLASHHYTGYQQQDAGAFFFY